MRKYFLYIVSRSEHNAHNSIIIIMSIISRGFVDVVERF